VQGLKESPLDNLNRFWTGGPGVATAAVSGGVQVQMQMIGHNNFNLAD